MHSSRRARLYPRRDAFPARTLAGVSMISEVKRHELGMGLFAEPSRLLSRQSRATEAGTVGDCRACRDQPPQRLVRLPGEQSIRCASRAEPRTRQSGARRRTTGCVSCSSSTSTCASSARLCPPGVPIIAPGERFDRASDAIDYLQTFAGCADAFGGFEHEMQGVATATCPDGQSCHGVYCVKGV